MFQQECDTADQSGVAVNGRNQHAHVQRHLTAKVRFKDNTAISRSGENFTMLVKQYRDINLEAVIVQIPP